MKRVLLLLWAAAFALGSCSDDAGVYEEFDKPDVEKPGGWVKPEPETDYEKYGLAELAEKAGIQLGAAVVKDDLDKSAISSLVYKHFKSVTFGNEMKNDAIMQSNGKLSFDKSGQMVTDIQNNNLQIFGHVLGWHSQQKYGYLNGLVESAAQYGDELKVFINFEGENSSLSAWGDKLVKNEKVTDPKLVFAGNEAQALTVTAGEVYEAQANIYIPNAVVGQTYAIGFWMKAAQEGKIRISTSDNQYLYDPTTISTDWLHYTAHVKAKEIGEDGSFQVRLDLAYVDNTYYIDNLRVTEVEDQTPTVNYISPDDILGDGTFEDYADFNAAYTGQGWNNYGNSAITVTTTDVHNGERAVQVDALAPAENKWTHQVIWPAEATAKKDGAHVVGMWVKAAEFADATATEGFFQIKVTTTNSGGDKYIDQLKVTKDWSFVTLLLDEATYGIKAGDKIAVVLMLGGTDNSDNGNAGPGIRQMRLIFDDMQIYPEGSDPDPGTGGGESFINEGSILPNGDLEAFTSFDDLKTAGWNSWQAGTLVNFVTEGAHSGNNAIMADNSAGGTAEYEVELILPALLAEKAGSHTVGFWAKADIDERDIQLAVKVDGSTYYRNSSWGAFTKATNEWSYIAYEIKDDSGNAVPIEADSEIQVSFQFGGSNTAQVSKIWIDDLQIYPTPVAATAANTAFYQQMVALNAQMQELTAAAMETTTKTTTETADDRIDVAFKNWVFGMMAEYGDKVYAWDAINELFDDGTNKPRNNNRQLVTTGHFYWGDFMGGGENWAIKTFQYAKAAKPDAVLYINDYNLEYSTGKLDAFCAFVEKYKSLGIIDGVGTQMHTFIGADRTKIDNMFQKLAATGLKVRISELDIDANQGHTLTALTADVAQKQAELYTYIFQSYLTHVPEAQRGGITIWGVRDDGSWLNDDKGDAYPLLFDATGAMKPAFTALYDLLLEVTGTTSPKEE